MRGVFVAASWAAGLIGLCLVPSAASAQSVESRRSAGAVDEVSRAASPYNARYIPGVGFRYTYPGAGPQVYGYVRYARSYKARRPAAYRKYYDRRGWW